MEWQKKTYATRISQCLFLSSSETTSVMTVSYVVPNICFYWFLLLVFLRTNEAGISGEETVYVKRPLISWFHAKVLFTISLSSLGDFCATVAFRTLLRVFHNVDHIPIQKTGCCHLKFSKFSHCNRNCLSDTIVFHIIFECKPQRTLC